MLPKLQIIKKETDMISEFLGYNNQTVISENQFKDENNMSSCEYPVLRVRNQRSKKLLFQDENDVNVTLCSNSKLAYTRGTDLYYDGTLVAENFATGANDELVTMGTRIISFPAKKIYDVEENKVKNIEASFNPTLTAASESLSLAGRVADFTWINTNGTIKKNRNFYIEVQYDESYFYEDEKAEFVYFVDKVIENDLEYASFTLNAIDITFASFEGLEDSYVWKDSGGRHVELVLKMKSLKTIKKNYSCEVETFSFTLTYRNTEDVTGEDPVSYVEVYMIDDEGDEYDNVYEQDTAPDNPSDGMHWIDTSQTPPVMKMYSSNTAMWAQVISSTYKVEYKNTQLPEDFKKYDNITIDCGNLDANSNYIENDVCGEWVIQDVGENYFTINAVLSRVDYEFFDKFNISRICPDLKYLVECDNRIWGCNSETNEISCCKLGDPTNWYAYEDISTDSYAVTVGSEGEFTGSTNYLGYILFFKKNYIHKIYGTKPSNFSLKTVKIDGIEEGSNESTVMIDGTLFYHGKDGVYVYNGSTPSKISDCFGTERYTNGKAAAKDGKYYILFDQAAFSYDAKYGIWHKESTTEIVSNIINHYLDIYYVTKEENNYYLNRFEEYDADNIKEEQLEWYCESGEIGLALPRKKYVGRILIRADVEENASFSVSVQYDSIGEFVKIYEVNDEHTLYSLNIPIIPRRCDHMKIRFEGSGICRIYSLTKEIEGGSEK